MSRAFRYSRWDGTQAGFELGSEEVLAEITDDVLYHGDLNAALRRMLQGGFDEPDGGRVRGLRELLETLRRRRREELERYDLGGPYADIANELRAIVEAERSAIEQDTQRARDSGDPARRETAEQAAAERNMRLDLLPPDLAGQVQALRQYDFTSPEAERRFEALLDSLREQLLASQFNQMSAAMQDMSPQDLARFKDMLSELNQMLDQRARGHEPDFEGFMSRYGDFFPGNPQTLDELLEEMAQQMAAMQALLNSMTPEQRAQLQALSAQLLDDMDLRWQIDQLGRNLQAAFPQMGWDRSYPMSGLDPLSLLEGSELMEQLGQLDQLEHLLSSATSPAQLAEVDLEAARRLLGDDSARDLKRLADLARVLEEAGLISQREGRYELTPQGLRRIGQRALADLFGRLDKDRFGGHQVDRAGVGHERTYESKPYEYGDPFNLDVERTIRNAVARTGEGVPVRLEPADFEVAQTEALTRTSTALLLDLSLSMPMRDNFLAAKKVAMALHALISSRFPRDYLAIVGFSEIARVLPPAQLPEVSWDFVYGTNMQHALLVARQLLSRQPGTRQVLMVTDGEPTAHLLPGGEPFFHYPPTHETLEATLAEVMRCTAEGIRINTFLLDATESLQSFIERLARINRGRVFLTTPDTLGRYVLVDYLEGRLLRAIRA
ncbi:MAG: vWA domain-containing protein [Acidimicrobiales bacterium]